MYRIPDIMNGQSLVDLDFLGIKNTLITVHWNDVIWQVGGFNAFEKYYFDSSPK